MLERLQPPEYPFKKLFGACHVLGDIGLKMSGAGLPVVRRIADTAGEEDKLVGIDRWKNAVFGIATDHPETVDQHADEKVGLA